jgi:hypothetical protein
MRLLNTSTIKLEEFMAEPPRYAILSHTWYEFSVWHRALMLTRQGARVKHYSPTYKTTPRN